MKATHRAGIIAAILLIWASPSIADENIGGLRRPANADPVVLKSFRSFNSKKDALDQASAQTQEASRNVAVQKSLDGMPGAKAPSVKPAKSCDKVADPATQEKKPGAASAEAYVRSNNLLGAGCNNSFAVDYTTFGSESEDEKSAYDVKLDDKGKPVKELAFRTIRKPDPDNPKKTIKVTVPIMETVTESGKRVTRQKKDKVPLRIPTKPGACECALPFNFRLTKLPERAWRNLTLRFKDSNGNIVKEMGCKVTDVGPWLTDDPYFGTPANGCQPEVSRGGKKLARGPHRGDEHNGAGIDVTPGCLADGKLPPSGGLSWSFKSAGAI